MAKTTKAPAKKKAAPKKVKKSQLKEPLKKTKVKKATTKNPPLKKAATKKAVEKKVSIKKPSEKKASTEKESPKKVAAKKPVSKKVEIKKSVTKKSSKEKKTSSKKSSRFASQVPYAPLSDLLNQEWVETNGLGGYSSSTVVLSHTRKYHGLLVCAPTQTVERINFLSHLELTAKYKGKSVSLNTHQYPDFLHPASCDIQSDFRAKPFPHFRYQFAMASEEADTIIEVSLMMAYGEKSLCYRIEVIEAPGKIEFVLRPLLAFRSHHALSKENFFVDPKTAFAQNAYIFKPYGGLPPLAMAFSKKIDYYTAPDWYRNFEYRREIERGYDAHEDLYSPGVFEFSEKPGKSVYLQASVLDGDPYDKDLIKPLKPKKLFQENEKEKLKSYSKSTLPLEDFKSHADIFLISSKREKRPSIIAGFPWFGEWGRDTLIALNGLTSARGKSESALEILLTYASFCQEGLIPNMLGSTPSTSAYNSVDAALWYFLAVQQYLELSETKPTELPRIIVETLQDILGKYLSGQHPLGYVDSDTGFLFTGSSDTQLTWMDAHAWGAPVTPRNGAAIEINALWYNALRFIKNNFPSSFRGQNIGLQEILTETILKIENNFVSKFWLEEEGYFADYVSENGEQSHQLRPNQLVALGVPYSPVDEIQPIKHLRCMENINRYLLTAKGLRTLSPQDPAYRGVYTGDQNNRDATYHQGTVWPWLVGPYGDACLRIYEKWPNNEVNSENIKRLKTLLSDFIEASINENGLLSGSEIHDGDSPHSAKGTPFQAWSVSEPIRILTMLEKKKLD